MSLPGRADWSWLTHGIVPVEPCQTGDRADQLQRMRRTVRRSLHKEEVRVKFGVDLGECAVLCAVRQRPQPALRISPKAKGSTVAAGADHGPESDVRDAVL